MTEPWALGELGLQPWEFWRLTPEEFRIKREAFFRAENRAWLHTYELYCASIAPWAKKRPSVEKLMGRRMLNLWPHKPKDRD